MDEGKTTNEITRFLVSPLGGGLISHPYLIPLVVAEVEKETIHIGKNFASNI